MIPGPARRGLVAAAAAAVLVACGAPAAPPAAPPAAAATPTAATPAPAAPSAAPRAAAPAVLPAPASPAVLHRATVLPRSLPTGIDVPAIRMHAATLLGLGLDRSGALQVPPDAYGTGWFTESPAPGSPGPAVIVAHVDYAGVLGPFHRLHEMKVGDEITVRRADGTTAVFGTYRVERYAKSTFPTDDVYGDTRTAELRLITCGGVFDRATGQYEDDIVVYAGLLGVR